MKLWPYSVWLDNLTSLFLCYADIFVCAVNWEQKGNSMYVNKVLKQTYCSQNQYFLNLKELIACSVHIQVKMTRILVGFFVSFWAHLFDSGAKFHSEM